MNTRTLLQAATLAGAWPLAGAAQNLVQNGSFEDFTTCPSFPGYVQYATGWQNLHTNSADYFHRCQADQVVGVPFNNMGYQEPADGDGYVGLATSLFNVAWYREIVGIELATPLQAGVPVCLSFKAAIGGFGSWPGNSAMYTAKGVGLKFFNDFPSDWQAYLYPNSAALALDVVPTDTAIWYMVSGEYMPDSNYTHLAIGNFFADSMSAIEALDTSGYGAWGTSYVFIDDVRVSYDLAFCDLNSGTGVEAGRAVSLKVHPNPFVQRFVVELGRPAQGTLQWGLFDLRGRPLLTGIARSGVENFRISAEEVRDGTYLLMANDEMGAFAPVRLVSVSP